MSYLKSNLLKLMGNRISKARKDIGQTQEDFCESIFTYEEKDEEEIKIERYRKWEYGENDIPPYIIKRIAEKLNCDIGYLFGEINEPRKEIIDVEEATGLSYKTCETLKRFMEKQNQGEDEDKNINLNSADVMNLLLGNEKFLSLIDDIAKATNTKMSALYDFTDLMKSYPSDIKTDTQYVYNVALAFKFYEIYMEIINNSINSQERYKHDKYDDELLDE